MTTNNENRNDNRKKQVTFGVITAAVIIVIILLLRSCSAGNGNESYTMKLNGDNPFEIAMGEQYVDPGVTFFDEDGDPVPEDKQSELEQKLTITNEVDTSKAGEYLVTYEYNKQTLERTVKVLAGSNSNTPGDNTDKNTGDKDNQQGTTGNETSTTPEPSDSNNNGNNGNSTTDKPGTSGEGTGTQTTPTPGPGNNDDDNNNDNDDNTEPEKKVYYLTNTRYNSRTVTYNGEEFTLTATNVPYGIIPIYTNNSGTNAGRYDSEVVFVLSDALKSQYSSIEPASMTATLTIRQAKPSYTVPTGLTANVGDTLADVKLPKGFSFEKSLTTSVGGVGYHTFYVTYTPDDTINYQTVHHIAVVIKVTDPSGGDDDKVVYYLPSNTFFNNRTVTYNGSSYSIFAENVPANINVRYVNNTGTDAGTYNAIVYYTVGEALKDQCSRVEPSSMRATLTILKAVPRYTVPTGLTAYVGQTLKDVTLPKGFTFEDPLTTSVGNVGARTFKVTYTPEDTKNYEIVTGIDVTITVTQKPGPGPDPVKPVYKLPSNVTFPDVNEVYTGQTYTAEAVNVPTGIIATYSNATRSDAGTQQATVVFSLSDSMAKLYSGVEPASMTATISIAQATPSYTVPTNLTAQEGQTLADVRNQLGTGFTFEDPLNTSVGPVGDNDFTVTYNPGNTNYKTVTGIKVTIHVTKTPDPTKPKYTIPATVGFNDLSGPYTGSEYVLEATNVPDVLTAVYSNNRRTEIGSQEATVTFALNNKGLESYSGIEGSNTMTAILNVTKAKPTYTAPGTLTAEEGQTLADIAVQLGTGFSFEDPLNTSVGSAGSHQFAVTYTPDDTAHYEVITGIMVTVQVTAKTEPPVVDKTELQKAKDIADGITNFGYTFDSYVAFTEAYEKASQMPESTQDEVDKKTASIKSALALLKSSGGTDVPEYPDNVDKTALQEAIDKANAVTSFGYTVESYTAFTEAYEKASQLPEVTQAEIIAKTDAINAALALLVSSSGSDPDHNENVDKAALNEATARAEAVTGFGYTVESYEAFATAYATASSLPEDTQEQINTKADAINTALALLVSSSDSDPDHTENVNKDALEAAKNDADAITGFGYTVESYEAFESAYASAVALPEDTQEEIDNKVSAIRAAISLLVSSSFTPDYSENETAATLSDATSTALDEASTLVEETIIDEEDAKGEEEEVVEEEDVPEEDSEPQDSQPIDAIPNEIVVEDPANNYKQDELTYSENDDPNKEDSEENSNNDEGGDESEDAAIPEGDGEAE